MQTINKNSLAEMTDMDLNLVCKKSYPKLSVSVVENIKIILNSNNNAMKAR